MRHTVPVCARLALLAFLGLAGVEQVLLHSLLSTSSSAAVGCTWPSSPEPHGSQDFQARNVYKTQWVITFGIR